MKNIMKFSGVAGTILLGFAALFKIQHWPAAGIMLTLGALLLAFLFLPSALSVLWKESHSAKRVFLYVSAFLAAFFFIMGALFKIQHWPLGGFLFALAFFSGTLLFIPALLARLLKDSEPGSGRLLKVLAAAGLFLYFLSMLFKIQHWPGSGVLLVSGLVVLFIIVLPWYTWATYKNENNIKGSFLFIVIGSLAIVIPGALINLNLQNSYDAGYYRNLEQQQAATGAWLEHNRSFINNFSDSLCYADMLKLDTQAATVVDVLNRIEKEMVMESEGKPGMPVAEPFQVISGGTGQEIRFRQLSRPFDFSVARNHLATGTRSAGELAKALNDYNAFLAGISAGKELPDFGPRLDPAVCLGPAYADGNDLSLLSALHVLNLTKNQVLAIEAAVLNEIATN